MSIDVKTSPDSELMGKFEAAENLFFGRNGVTQSPEEAAKLYLECAEGGHCSSMTAIALYYYDGFGFGEERKKQWEMWIQRAANAGERLGKAYCLYFGLGEGNEHDYQLAYALARDAADDGDVRAMHFVGNCFRAGKGIVDHSQGVHWWKLAAAQGYAPTQYKLGLCYMDGRGVEQDYTQAVSWYKMAANQGLTKAQCSLGLCHYEGKGVNQDYVFYFHAFAKNFDVPLHHIIDCLRKIAHVKGDRVLPAEWAWKYIDVIDLLDGKYKMSLLSSVSRVFWNETLPPLRFLAARAVLSSVEDGLECERDTYHEGIVNEVELVKLSLDAYQNE